MFTYTFVVLLASVVYARDVTQLPFNLKPCSRNDPNLSACALERGREILPRVVEGDRKNGIPSLDPLDIQEISVVNGPNQAGIALKMKDVKIHGLKGASLEKADINLVKKRMAYELNVPILAILGKYEISGRLLVLPISGKGDINITLVDDKLFLSHSYILHEGDGKTDWTPKDFKTRVDPSMAYIHFENLFNGDKTLGKQMNDFLKENWQDVYKDLSPVVTDAITEVVLAIVNKLAKFTPFDVAFPE